MLNRANDTHNWIHKNKSFLNSFAQIARFSVEIKPQRRTGDDEMTSDNLNDFNVTMDELKKKKLIKLDLKRVTTVIEDYIPSSFVVLHFFLFLLF